jgi:hypothetical protein
VNPTDFSQIPLRDIHLPAAVGWWPPAPGWWILAGVVVLAAVMAYLRYHRRFRERAALKALRGVLAALEGGEEPIYCLQRVSMIVRRFAMSIAARGDVVAGLTGERWLGYLDSRWERDAFSHGPGRSLAVAPYAPPDRVHAEDVLELGKLCIDWVGAQAKRKEA